MQFAIYAFKMPFASCLLVSIHQHPPPSVALLPNPVEASQKNAMEAIVSMPPETDLEATAPKEVDVEATATEVPPTMSPQSSHPLSSREVTPQDPQENCKATL